MGSYNTAVITTVGQALLTSVIGTQGTMTFTKLQTSSYAYASGTDLSALTSLNNVEQEANIGSATIVDSIHIAADATISNSGISTEYNANTLGIFASDGVNEVLFAVSTAVTPDVIPADQGGTPSTYKYNFTLAVSSTSDITISAVGNIDASDVAYDNSVSGLSATNVQAAIDEIVSSVKRTGKITLSAVSVELTNETPTATVSFTTNSDGVASVASSDPTIATASLSGTDVTITGLKSGTPTVTISIPETEHCTACSAAIAVTSTVFTVGETYKLGSGAHTSGTADLECVVLDIIGTNAICQSKGIYGAAWPGISELTSVKSTYFGLLSDAVSGVYLPRGNADGSETTTTPTDVYVYDGSSFVNTYSSDVKTILTTAANNYSTYGASYSYSWLGTPYNSSRDWCVYKSGVIDNIVSTNSQVIAPTFILDLTKVKLYGDLIVDINADPAPTVVTFANGTDAQIKAMLDGYYAGIITWEQMGWNVGDTRLIHFDAMQAPNPNSSNTWAAQDITIVITAHDHNNLATPINGHTKACITVQTREVMNNCTSAYDDAGHIHFNGHASAEMTFTPWKNLYMNTYLNTVVLDAIPAGDFKSAIKTTNHYRHTAYNTADDELVSDTLFLPSYPEIFGTTEYSYYTPTTHTEGTQWAYYETSANRVKYGNNAGESNGVAQDWWNGSTTSYYHSSWGYYWGIVAHNGTSNQSDKAARALAPAWGM